MPITTSLPSSRLFHPFRRLCEAIEGYTYGKASGDPNTYTLGRIGHHNVVLAFMLGMGKGHSVIVAASFCSSFKGANLGLVIGICGGVPEGAENGREILLGDVIISTGPV
jgi:nucleoside phosphorylase